MRPPALVPFAHIEVEVGTPIELGDTSAGRRRIVPILGGSVDGDLLRGRVVPGGADYQLVHDGRVNHLEARYVIESDRGESVFVLNHALRTGSADDVARLLRGEQVPAERIYFRGTPVFETAAPRLRRLTERVFVCTGERHPDLVVLDVFELA